MRVNDIVRATSNKYPDTAIEGHVTYINNVGNYQHIDVLGMWDKTYVFSTEHFNVEVIRAVEPDKIGSTLIDKDNVTWTKFSNEYTLKWINERGVKADWHYVCNLISH